MAEPQPSFLASPSRPKLRLPPGAADTHVHVFGPHRIFPFAENRPFTPADAPKEKLFALHAMLGIQHCVIVQSTCHGFDNRVVADAIAAKNGDYCGIALVPPTVDDAELRRLDSQGFCGVRFNFMSHLGKGAGIEEAIALTPRLAKLGWHLQVHFEGSLIDELAPWFERSAVPVVIDSMGRAVGQAAPDASRRQPAALLPVQAMTRRLDGKVAIVTGAGSVGPGWGNGRATAVRFAEEGAKIFAVDREAERLRETVEGVKKAGGAIATHLCDVTRAKDVAGMVEACLKSYGR